MNDLVIGSTEFNIKQTISSLLLRHPFYGFLIQTMKWREDKTISTLATNSKEIIYNSEFFNSLPIKQRVFAIAHEIGHCMLSHCFKYRIGSRDREYWNMAIDYKVNSLLIRDAVGEIRTGDDGWLYEKKYDDMSLSSENIYDDLIKNKSKKQKGQDDHSKFGNEGNIKDINEANRIDAEFKQKVIQAHQFAKMTGASTANIETFISGLLNPKINWRTLLRTSIQSLFKSDTTWQKPNRRSIDKRFILPAIKAEETVDICVSLDTSGSMTEEMKQEMLSEICGILKYYKNFKLSLWCFDTEVHGFKKFTQSDIGELKKYKMIGGGGTDIATNFSFMKKENIKPKIFICFTDGYNFSESWGDSKYCPTTWIIHSNPNPNPPFGRFTTYDVN